MENNLSWLDCQTVDIAKCVRIATVTPQLYGKRPRMKVAPYYKAEAIRNGEINNRIRKAEVAILSLKEQLSLI
jgi:hypothetical protein